MATLNNALDAIERHIGFPRSRSSGVARRLQESKLLPAGAPGVAPELDQRDTCLLLATLRPEYTRRVKAMVAAVTALRVAREDYESLLDDFIANDIAWTHLVPMQPTFCGDRHDGHLDRYLRAAKEAGYAN